MRDKNEEPRNGCGAQLVCRVERELSLLTIGNILRSSLLPSYSVITTVFFHVVPTRALYCLTVMSTTVPGAGLPGQAAGFSPLPSHVTVIGGSASRRLESFAT